MNHFIAIADCTSQELRHLLDVSKRLKHQHKTTGRNDPILAGKTLAMIFEKPSLRTRISFETGMFQLGGHAIYLAPWDIRLGERETVADIARNLARVVDMIVARTFHHRVLVELAERATVPVVNGLSDLHHPCQVLADLLTLRSIGSSGHLSGLLEGGGNQITDVLLGPLAVHALVRLQRLC